MPHPVIALLYILPAAISCFCAFRQYQKENFQTSAGFLVIAGFLLRFFMASDMYLHEWDERYHALVARHLMDNMLLPKLYSQALLPFDFKDWSSNYIWLHKQPVPLWCMAVSMKVFGVNEIAMRLPSVVVSSIAIFFTWLIGKKMFNEKVGLLAAFFHAINGLVMDITSGRSATDHIDIFFLFFVELAVLLAVISRERKSIWTEVLVGVSIGLAVLCKWLPAFVVVPVWLVLNYNHRSIIRLTTGVAIICISAFVVFLPWQLYMYNAFPQEYANEMLHNYRHITEVLDKQEGGFFYFFGKLHINVNELFWPAFIWFCYGLYRRDNSINRLALLTWAIIPFVFFTIAKTKMHAYLLFTFPALFVMLAEFCVFLIQTVENQRRMKLQQLIFAVIIILAVRFSIERIKPLQDQSKQLAWAIRLKEIGKTANEKQVYLNIKHNIEGMFYTNAIMYGYIPEPKQVEEIKVKGYEVIVDEDPEL